MMNFMRTRKMDYDINEIKLPITLRTDKDTIVQFTLDSGVLSDETLSMIFKDIDKELERKGYAT